ncbi:MAG: endonuclease domain-containing protein [Deltaproteobacteria bacterium]|nr:endonuclease domain-containing protein [Deltaproteobacteria bacterium]
MLTYKAKLKHKARQLRKNMTDSERTLWGHLRGKQLLGVQFYRQKPIGDYIVDFYAPKTKLVIEVDGSQHTEEYHADKDRQRDDHLKNLGFRVLRFNSREVLKETDSVVDVICRAMLEYLSTEKSPPAPLCQRGGEELMGIAAVGMKKNWNRGSPRPYWIVTSWKFNKFGPIPSGI